jgi:hypothetical protein
MPQSPSTQLFFGIFRFVGEKEHLGFMLIKEWRTFRGKKWVIIEIIDVKWENIQKNEKVGSIFVARILSWRWWYGA